MKPNSNEGLVPFRFVDTDGVEHVFRARASYSEHDRFEKIYPIFLDGLTEKCSCNGLSHSVTNREVDDITVSENGTKAKLLGPTEIPTSVNSGL